MTKPYDIVDQLDALSDLKVGAKYPDWLGGPNNWGDGLRQVFIDAMFEIRDLRGQLERKSENV